MRSASPAPPGPLPVGHWATRPFVLTYRPGQTNRCPGCSGMHWHVGRQTAECAFCSTALPIADPAVRQQFVAPSPTLAGLRSAWRAIG
jgi:hypothetical protein